MPYETGAVPPTRLFVGGLAPGVSAMQLKEIFEPHGDIVRMQVKDTDKDVNYAFVEYADEDAAQRAISSLDETEVNGRRINVSKARGPKNTTGGGFQGGGRAPYGGGFGGPRFGGAGGGRGRASPPGRLECQLEFSDLPVSFSWQDLKDHARVPGHRVLFADVISTGVGLVEYASEADAADARAQLDGKECGGQSVTVRTPDVAYKGVGGFLRGQLPPGAGGGGRYSGGPPGGYERGNGGYDDRRQSRGGYDRSSGPGRYDQPPPGGYDRAPAPRGGYGGYERSGDAYGHAPPPRAPERDAYGREPAYGGDAYGRERAPEPHYREQPPAQYRERERYPPPGGAYDSYDTAPRPAPRDRYDAPQGGGYESRYDAPPRDARSDAPPPRERYDAPPPRERYAEPPRDSRYDQGAPREYYSRNEQHLPAREAPPPSDYYAADARGGRDGGPPRDDRDAQPKDYYGAGSGAPQQPPSGGGSRPGGYY